MFILGLNGYMHDASASLIHNGQLVAFAEEERFIREKHTSKFPYKAIEFCLKKAGITINEVEHIGFFWKPWKGIINRIWLFIQDLQPHKIFSNNRRNKIFKNMLKKKKKIRKEYGYRNQFHFIEHHLAHCASSFLISPFENSAILTIDANGELATTLIALGIGNEIYKLKEIWYPNSLGLLYASVTEYLGFRENNGEGKVMGLSAYGKPIYYDKFKKIVRFNSHGEFYVDMDYFDIHLTKEKYVRENFIELFGPPRMREGPLTQRHADIAASLQKVLEEAVIKLVKYAKEITKQKNLSMAGGVVLNSVMNGKIKSMDIFENIFFQPASNDAGTSLGCAFYIWNVLLGQKRKFVFEHPYWGPEYSEIEILNAIKKYNLNYTYYENIEKITAELLSKGYIIGWFQGRMEVGPRALGNRSILADPRKAEMKDILNLKVKHRESFRPFAPSVLEEYASEFFNIKGCDPYMITVWEVKEEKRKLVPAITHVDGTARVQTVSKKTNPKYWKLIDYFSKITGIPVILNTSFNVRGEPIVCSPEDAINCFLKTQMDYLILGNYLIDKSNLYKEGQ